MVSSGFVAKGTTLVWNNVPVLEPTNIDPGVVAQTMWILQTMIPHSIMRSSFLGF